MTGHVTKFHGFKMEWTSDKWYHEITSFRRNPQVFLSVKMLDEEAFVLDILQALCLETVSIQVKIHVLGLIQEYGVILCSNPTTIEQVVASLQDIFLQTTPDGASNICFMGQILTTITNLLITSEQLLTGGMLLFINFVNVLLNTMSRVNSGSDRSLRSIACECLTAIEVAYPGIFMRKLEHFSQICRKENTSAFQNYATLFITALKNAVHHMTTETPSVNLVNDILCNRIEPLKPLSIPPHILKPDKQMVKQGSLQECLSEEVDTLELKRVTSDIMELCPLMTTSCIVNLAIVLADIVKTIPDLSPSIFKSLVLKYLPSSDISMLHLLFMLKLRFGNELFSEAESKELVHRLVLAANSPCMSLAQSLLLLEWIKSFLDRKIGDEKDFLLDRHISATFSPSIFDGADSQVKKLQLLSLARKHLITKDDTWMFLMDNLICLHKSTVCGQSGHRSVALFRALFHFHSDHQVSQLDGHIQSFLVGLLTEHPRFSAHVLDFLESVLSFTPESTLPLQLLSQLVKIITRSSQNQALSNIHFYLSILERASQEVQIYPVATITFLQNLLSETLLCEHGDWRTGSELVAICKSILAFHDTRSFHSAIGCLLFTLFTKYQDVEIRDRSKFYYALFCNLSSDKVSSILLQSGDKNRASEQLSNMVTGSTNFPPAAPVEKLDSPIIQLIRVDSKPNRDLLSMSVPPVTLETDLLTLYKTCILSPNFNPSINLCYQVKLVKDAGFETVYAVAFHLETPKYYKEIANVYISSLSNDSIQEKVISLTLSPEQPVPVSIDIKAIFASTDSKTYECQLHPVSIAFMDLFLPLPVPPGVDITNHQLFDTLWSHFTSKEESEQCLQSFWNHVPSSQSVALNDIIQAKLPMYVVHADEQDGIYHVGILLPPQHHLLLKINNICFTITTDNWKILPLVHKWLNGLFQ